MGVPSVTVGNSGRPYGGVTILLRFNGVAVGASQSEHWRSEERPVVPGADPSRGLATAVIEAIWR